MARVNGDLIFIHIPKTAGISIGQAFLNDPTYVGDHTRVSYKYKSTKWRKFMVCRNPYDRMVSSYEYQKKMAGRGVGLRISQRSFIQKEKATFSEFVNFIHSSKKVNELHTRPQTYWMQYENGAPILDIKIIRFEDLKNELDEFFTTIGRRHLDIKTKNFTVRSSFLDYYSNPETVAQVKELYADDFKEFNYSTNLEDTKVRC